MKISIEDSKPKEVIFWKESDLFLLAINQSNEVYKYLYSISPEEFVNKILAKSTIMLNLKRNSMKLINLLALLPFFWACSDNQSSKTPYSQLGLDTTADTYAVTVDDTSMNAAIRKAQKTITEFDQALESNNPSYTDFAIKKRYKTTDGGEHMWIAGIIFVNGNYKGFINNDAEKTTEVKYGDTVFVRKEEITDWMYLHNNVLRGGYTIREVRNQLTKEERIKMDKELSFKIED
ncbi:MAG: DUF2314 domain-containing protein [Chitinophagaceae bacterium]|nr:MAG: DUF2314 domain-containing protein [Chitinophagaceae bacterium]